MRVVGAVARRQLHSPPSTPAIIRQPSKFGS